MEFGIFSFAERRADPGSPLFVSPAERIARLLEEARLADQVGLDVFGVGEHHRPDFVTSAPAVALAAVAAQTSRIRLTSAVTVLSSDDPVRVFQEFATLDLISQGRAEIMAGRGSFTESFPLFGYDLADYDALFAEKLELLLALRDADRVSWRGRFRAPLTDQPVYPRPVQSPIPVWIAVGGTPESAMRAGRLGLPMALAIIGGQPARFRRFTDLYRDAGRRAGHGERLRLGINSHGFLAGTSQEAAERAYPSYAHAMNQIGRERGWPPLTRADFDAQAERHGAIFVGSPAQVVDKILFQHEIFRHDRFLLQLTVGGMPHREVLRAIELFGTEVVPQVRKALAPVHG
jgi:probable LLM family oxidoreductase